MKESNIALRRATDRPKILPIKQRLRIYRIISNLLATRSAQQLADSFEQMRGIVMRNALQLPDPGHYLPFLRLPRFDFSPTIARGLSAWSMRLRSGERLSQAMAGWVPQTELNIILAGERSDQLSNAFNELISTVTVIDELQNKLVSALTYPVIVFAGAILIATYIALTMVPEFRDISPNQHRQFFTHVLLAYTMLVEKVPYLVAASFIIAGLLFYFSFARWTRFGRSWADRMLPPYALYRQVYGLAFMRAYDVLTRSGTQGGIALELLGENANPYLQSRIFAIGTRYGPGASLGVAMDNTGHRFPDPSMIEGILLLPEDANYSKNLRYIVDSWQIDIQRVIDKQTQLLNTFAIIGIGFMVITIWIGLIDLVPIGELTNSR